MCAAPCAAAVGGRAGAAPLAFHAARIAGYALGGALAAASVATLAAWSQLSPALRPLWVLLHAAALMLGLWLLITARQPGWLARLGRLPDAQGQPADGWQRMRGPARSAVAGGLWVAWPCGLLQSALMVAAMASGPAGGAATMAAFGIASAPGLVLGPWVWQRLLRGSDAAARDRLAARAAGLLLAGASGWALGKGVWHQVAAFCATLW